MIPSSIYVVIGLALIALSVADHLRFEGKWKFHAFYTGLLLVITGEVLEYLLLFRSLSDAHLATTRSLIEQVIKVAPRP